MTGASSLIAMCLLCSCIPMTRSGNDASGVAGWSPKGTQIPGPPPGCTGTYVIPVLTNRCLKGLVGTLGAGEARDGIVDGAGASACALARADDGHLQWYLFVTGGTVGTFSCRVEDCLSEPIAIGNYDVSPSPGVLGAWVSVEQRVEPIDPPIVLPGGAGIIARAIDIPCPAGEFPGAGVP